MSSPHDPTNPTGGGGPATGAGPEGAPSEEELRAAYEAELARITAVDMLAQSAVSLLNIGARRMGPPPGSGESEAGRDLEQVRDAIDGARALLAILERRIPQELGPLKDALSRLQMAYAQELGAAGAPAGGEPKPGEPKPGEPKPGGQQGTGGPAQRPADEPQPGGGQQPGGPGPAESSGRLWVPGR
jgi:hypothetical protein